jgi:hypothetical protein
MNFFRSASLVVKHEVCKTLELGSNPCPTKLYLEIYMEYFIELRIYLINDITIV